MFSMVYVGAQRFFIAPQIAPHLPLLRPICHYCAPFAIIAPLFVNIALMGIF